MIDVRDIRLIEEIPENLRRDKRVVALAESLDRSLEAPSKMIDRINYEMDLKNHDESVIDHLLWENNIGQYEGLMFVRNKQEKINLLESAIELKRTKGTPYAIEKVLEVMGMRGYVEEWFQYDSLPFHFLVELEITNDFREIKDVRSMVLHYKNTRSWFDGFVILVAPGGFIIFDDSYSYPVFYKDCGWFSGEKYFAQLIIQAMETANDTYDYNIPYYAYEKLISYFNTGSLKLIDDTYSYAKEFKTAGELEPITKEVCTQSEEFKCRNKEYDYSTLYDVSERRSLNVDLDKMNVCEFTYEYIKKFQVSGEMEPLKKVVDTSSDMISTEQDNYSYIKTFLVCGEFYTGE